MHPGKKKSIQHNGHQLCIPCFSFSRPQFIMECILAETSNCKDWRKLTLIQYQRRQSRGIGGSTGKSAITNNENKTGILNIHFKLYSLKYTKHKKIPNTSYTAMYHFSLQGEKAPHLHGLQLLLCFSQDILWVSNADESSNSYFKPSSNTSFKPSSIYVESFLQSTRPTLAQPPPIPIASDVVL